MADSQQGMVSELWGKKFYILKAMAVIFAFWLLQYAYQLYILNVPFPQALVRSAALSGATLVSLALLSGPLAVLYPKINFVEYRRTLGVSGFVLIVVHFSSVLNLYFMGDLSKLFWDWNPFKNPLLFGFAAYWLLVPLFLTSTDWAVRKLSFARWKTVHRLIYFAFLLAILHFVLIGALTKPGIIFNLAGYLLLSLVTLTLILQLVAFIRRIRSRPKLMLGAWVGFAIILLYAVLLGIIFFFLDSVNK